MIYAALNPAATLRCFSRRQNDKLTAMMSALLKGCCVRVAGLSIAVLLSTGQTILFSPAAHASTIAAACEAGSGWYMVGIRARIGVWFDALGAVCSQLQADKSFSGHRLTSMYGGQGGAAPREFVCGPTEAITDFTVDTTDTKEKDTNNPVYSFNVTCADLRNGQKRSLLAKGSFKSHSFTGTNTFSCPPGQIAFGLQLGYGTSVTSASALCAQYRYLPQIPQIPDPSIALHPNDPARAGTQNFRGTWLVHASNGATWDLTMNVSGTQVTGEFSILGQPKFKGTLSGQATSPGVLFFNWSQPQMGTGGAGSLVVYANDTLRGNLNLGKPNTPLIEWKGTLRSRPTASPPASTPPTVPGAFTFEERYVNLATALQDNTVYKAPSGDPSPGNKVCEMRTGDTGRLLSKGENKWVQLGSISGGCNGKSGWVWNDGELRLP
jgi:hypothetical protein